MKTISLKFLFCILLASLSFNAKATHILNGEFDAFILKSNADSITYSITLNIRAMCDSNAIQLPPDLFVCIYDASSGAFVKSGQMKKFAQSKESHCVGFCVKQVEYNALITVSKRDMYIFKTEICCRKSLANLRNDVNGEPYIGHSFFLQQSGNINIPRPQIDIPNVYNLNPGIADTLQYNIFDNYSDSISITRVTPYNGATAANNYPDCGTSFYLQNVVQSDYESGYNAQLPFGSNGTFSINKNASNIILKSPTKGEFVTAMRLKFFKNGKLYHETIREIHVVVSDYVLNNSNQATLSAKTIALPLAQLNWSICTQGLKGLKLERSDSVNTNFKEIASLSLSTFKLDDYDVNFGKVYFYRLKMFKVNDSFYSNEVKVTFFKQSIQDTWNSYLTITPNPFDNHLSISSPMAFQHIEIISYTGQSILSEDLENDTTMYNLNTVNLPSGLYTIECSNSNGVNFRQKIIKN